jgi:hypothetical protein
MKPTPTFFIAGAAKAATTSLHRYLGQHPQIHTSADKEPHFFDRRLPNADDQDKAWEHYLELFADGHTAQHRGESTPAYLHDHHAQNRIKLHLDRVKWIVSLRDPLKRAHSEWAHRTQRGEEDRGFLDALNEERTGFAEPDYLLRSRYDAHLSHLIDLYDRQAITPVNFHALASDTDATLRRLLAELNVEPTTEAIDTETTHNPAGSTPKIAQTLLDHNITQLLANLLPTHTRQHIGEHLLRRKSKPPLTDEARRLGAHIFDPIVDRTEDLLGISWPSLRQSW